MTLSRRDFLTLAGGGLGLVAPGLLTGCGQAPVAAPEGSTPPAGTSTSTRTGSTPPASATAITPTAAPTAASLDVQIGQMLIVGFRGLAVDDDHFVVRDIRERHLGGVVLFDYDVPSQEPVRNVQSPAQVETLVASLQAASTAPLLVAIDHEGGFVTRLKETHGFPVTLSHQALGAANDLVFTRERATAMGKTLADLGITLNLAPVVDLNVNPQNPIIARYERSFSADPETVTAHALAFVEGHHAQGVLCTLKHFPGHGSSTGDSHLGLVDVTDTWSRAELEPYANIIEAGQADAIMTAHVFNAHLDANDPATLSRPTIAGILRGELGYDGVVIADDMQMGAIARQVGFEMAVQRAIEAGVDILAFANNSVYEEDVAARTVTLVKRLVQEGIVSKERIAASYRRIWRLKQRLVSV